LWDPTSHKITSNRDVVFDESLLIKLDVDVQVKHAEVPQSQQIQFETHLSTEDNEHENFSEEVHAEENVDGDNNQQNVDQPQTSLRRSTWVRNSPRGYYDFVSFVSLITNDEEPTCYREEMKVYDSEKWKEPMKEKMNSLERNGTWDEV